MTLTAIKLPGTRPVPGRQRAPDHRHQRVKPSEMSCIRELSGGLGISCGLSKGRARGHGRCRAAGNPGTHRVGMTSPPLRAASLVSVRLCCSARVWVAETKTAGPASPQLRAVRPAVSPVSGVTRISCGAAPPIAAWAVPAFRDRRKCADPTNPGRKSGFRLLREP